jgi:hypothetical protein
VTCAPLRKLTLYFGELLVPRAEDRLARAGANDNGERNGRIDGSAITNLPF